jgi:hypothetical protein
MKYILIALAVSGLASAHEITGTPILKGSIKTKVVVDGLSANCKVKISKPRNLMVEDSYGNPAYTVNTEVSLDASNAERTSVISFSKYFTFTNIFTVGGKTEVRDFDYSSQDGATLKIDSAGRLKAYSFNYNQKTITCSF